MVSPIFSDSALLLHEIEDFICTMSTISEEEAMLELADCTTPVLLWVLNEVAIPNGQYDLAGLATDILRQRSCATC